MAAERSATRKRLSRRRARGARAPLPRLRRTVRPMPRPTRFTGGPDAPQAGRSTGASAYAGKNAPPARASRSPRSLGWAGLLARIRVSGGVGRSASGESLRNAYGNACGAFFELTQPAVRIAPAPRPARGARSDANIGGKVRRHAPVAAARYPGGARCGQRAARRDVSSASSENRSAGAPIGGGTDSPRRAAAPRHPNDPRKALGSPQPEPASSGDRRRIGFPRVGRAAPAGCRDAAIHRRT